jgi:hypothetical protein
MENINYNVDEKDMKELQNYLKTDGISFNTMTSYKKNHRALLVVSLGVFSLKYT